MPNSLLQACQRLFFVCKRNIILATSVQKSTSTMSRIFLSFKEDFVCFVFSILKNSLEFFWVYLRITSPNHNQGGRKTTIKQWSLYSQTSEPSQNDTMVDGICWMIQESIDEYTTSMLALPQLMYDPFLS